MVVNARDAMPKGGKILIETANVEFDRTYAESHSYVEPGHYVMLSVSDTGVGIDPVTKAHIFEPFFTTKSSGKGTGLGLSTVYGIVKQSGGSIEVYSELGHGTTFMIYFPQVEGEAATLAKTPVLGEKASETILLVEDDNQLRELVRTILLSWGYTVVVADRPENAEPLCSSHLGKIDLLLTDVVMPGMSGKEVADRVQQLRPEIKVLFMSGYTTDTVVQQGVLAEGRAFLQKPFSPFTLVTKIREVLDRQTEEVRSPTNSSS
jgi:CheY-like chemotaxis protein